jgi:hypothetical protein
MKKRARFRGWACAPCYRSAKQQIELPGYRFCTLIAIIPFNRAHMS